MDTGSAGSGSLDVTWGWEETAAAGDDTAGREPSAAGAEEGGAEEGAGCDACAELSAMFCPTDADDELSRADKTDSSSHRAGSDESGITETALGSEGGPPGRQPATVIVSRRDIKSRKARFFMGGSPFKAADNTKPSLDRRNRLKILLITKQHKKKPQDRQWVSLFSTKYMPNGFPALKNRFSAIKKTPASPLLWPLAERIVNVPILL